MVCVQPPTQLVETDASFTVDIVVDQVVNLGAYEFTLEFDPAVADFTNVTDGAFLGSTGRAVFCLGPTVTENSVRFICVTLGSEPDGPSGTGVLAQVSFSSVAPGQSTLHLTSVILTDIAGTNMPNTMQDGMVEVYQGPTATPCPGGICPTATSTPTRTSTPTPSGAATAVRIEPVSQNQLTGATFAVDVVVENVTRLAAYEFTLAFRPDTVELVSVTDGGFLGSTGRSVFCPDPVIGANTVRFGCASSGSTPDGPSGSGVLSELVFSAVAPGISPVDLVIVGLSDPLGSPIRADAKDGTVTVLQPTPTPCPGGICPTATITPTPTATALPTPPPTPVSCAPVDGTAVCIQPDVSFVPPGASFSVDVVVDNVTNLGAYEFTLGFDDAVIAFSGVTNGSFLGSTGRSVTCLSPTLGLNSVHFTCVTLGNQPQGPSGSGVLATVSLFALAEGTSPLDLRDVGVIDIFGTPIPESEQDGVVTVSSGPTPTPIATWTPGPSPTPAPTPTPGGTLVRVDPPSLAVAENSDFTVNIAVDNVANLGSYEWVLTFDPALLSFVSVVNGPFLGSTGRSVFCPGAILDAGTIRFGCATSGTAPGASGSGVLSTLTFSALAEGTSPLSLTAVSLSDPLANDIPTAIQNGSVTIVPVSTPTPTPTPTTEGAWLPQAFPAGGSALVQAGSSDGALLRRLLGSLTVVVGALGLVVGARQPRRPQRPGTRDSTLR